MLEIALHILDIVENSLAAGADLVQISLDKDDGRNLLTISITDNGSGIPFEEQSRVTDPFFTSRTTRRVGLGLSLLRQAAEGCGGSFNLESAPGRGTRVTVTFILSHLDRAPLGDMQSTLISLIVGRPDVDFVYRQKTGAGESILDTREIKRTLEDVPLSHPEVVSFLRNSLTAVLGELGRV